MEGDEKGKKWLKKYLEEHGNTWPEIAAGTDREIGPAAEYEVFGIPLSILIDRNGKVAAVDIRGKKLDDILAKTLKITEQ